MIKVPLKKNVQSSAKPEPQLSKGDKNKFSAYDIILGSVEIDTEQIPTYL
jgi:hypothetical protein